MFLQGVERDDIRFTFRRQQRDRNAPLPFAGEGRGPDYLAAASAALGASKTFTGTFFTSSIVGAGITNSRMPF